MNTKNLSNTLKIVASLIGIAGVSALFSVPSKAQANPNPSIFSEHPYNQNNVAQTSPGVGQQQNNPYTTPTTETDNINPGINQPVQDTTTPTNPGVNQPAQGTTTPGTTTPGVQDNDNNDGNNGVRALW